jgi:putative acetyltransferase
MRTPRRRNPSHSLASCQKGIAQLILARLEDLARVARYQAIRLETGSRQAEALRLYELAGYRRIAPYGIYVNDPLSICFEKALAQGLG